MITPIRLSTRQRADRPTLLILEQITSLLVMSWFTVLFARFFAFVCLPNL